MSSVMVVEDEHAIRSFIVLNLKRSGFEVVEASSGEAALDYLNENTIDIVLLDIMLPGIDGFEVCRQIRERFQDIGIIMLTAKVQEADKVSGLTLGADDYVSKPFSPVELIARVNSLVRRLKVNKSDEESNTITSGPFKLSVKESRLFKNQTFIDLTPTEFELVRLLMEHANESLTRDELLDHVWGKNYVGDTKIVDVNIRRLRRKIEDDPSSPKYVTTHWGRGYMWSGDA
ncbi:response regulator transcription factor [Scopulibacillus cellulosilyticus]|uniref:Response regulator transcription factor n=1 Tax=Scopulibacillus cellulosilyticus TaxID=2665665 RepID=A0ABW2PYH5_9BACL